MIFLAEVLAVVIALGILANRLVEGLITPIFDKFELDHFPLMYIAWGVSGLLVWLSGANLFTELIPNVLVGQILTALLSGGGANMFHDLFD